MADDFHSLLVCVDDATWLRLQVSAQEMGRSVSELAGGAVEEAALMAWRGRSDDPGAKERQP